jgi:multiple sugar transport system permease protein
MNRVQLLLLGVIGIFVLLYARSPRHPRHALVFGRWVVLVFGSILVLAPFLWLVSAIFKDKTVLNEYLFFPPPEAWSNKTMNLGSFRTLFEGKPSVHGMVYFWQYILNSVVFASVGTVTQLFFSSMAGYALAKYHFRGRLPLTLFVLGSMMIPSVLLLAPIYKLVVDLGLVDSLPGVLLPWLISAQGIFLFRQACVSVPNEMIDAARIDGAGEWRIYFRLVMPLVRPMTAAFCLISFLAHWNNFLSPSIILQSQDKLTLPIALNLMLSQYNNDYGVFLAGTALAMIPPAVLFLALQREFISGLTSGAVKG